MSSRFFAAGLFGGAAFVLFFGALPIVGQEFATYGAFSSIPVALATGWLVAPRLKADALARGNSFRGGLAGFVVTLGIYGLAASVLAITLTLPLPDQSISVVVKEVLGSIAFVLIIGTLFLVPALVLGALAGWTFYVYTLRHSAAHPHQPVNP